MSDYEHKTQQKIKTKQDLNQVETSWSRTNYVDQSGLELTIMLDDKQLLKPQH